MKNIDIDMNEEIDLGAILNDVLLPVTINNEYVVIDFEEYLKDLSTINPEKANEVLDELYEALKDEYFALFTREKLSELRENLLDVFEQASEEDFKSRETIDMMLGTGGFLIALENTFDKNEDFIDWYKKLTWYKSDEFDAKVGDMLVAKEDIF